jgi:hypothetical protein
LAQKFRLTREGVPYLAFRTAARGMSAEAQSQKEILVKHGLLDSVLQSLTQALDQFDRAVEQGTEGRRAHVGATAELQALAEELVQVVRLMDGSNRYRFADDPESLAQWESASNVIGPPRGGKAVGEAVVDKAAVDRASPDTPLQDGEIKPAA